MIVRQMCLVLVWAGLATPALAQATIPIPPPAPAANPIAIRPAKPRFVPVLNVLPPPRLASLDTPTVPDAAQAYAPPPRAPSFASLFRPGVAPQDQTAPDVVAPETAPVSVYPALPTATPLPTAEGIRRRGSHRDMAARAAEHPEIDALIATHAKANGIPESIVHRIVIRESRYNPRAVGSGGAMGLMQIKHATARGMGYTGPASGLLDADTNLRYAVPYLAGAWRTANGNPDRTVAYYASGYYYAAKSRGMKPARPSELTAADTDGLTQAQRSAAARPSIFSIFAGRAKPVDPNQVPTR